MFQETDFYGKNFGYQEKSDMKSGSTISILVLCEDPDDRALLIAELELIGYWGQVKACANPAEAQALAEAQKPDLLIVRFTRQSEVQSDDLNDLIARCKASLVQGPESLASLFSSGTYLPVPYRIEDLIGNIKLLANSDLSIDALAKNQTVQAADAEGRYKDLFDRASDAIMLIDCLTHTIIDVNFRAVDIYGYSKDEFIGMNLLQMVPSEHHISVHKNTREMASAVQPHVIEVGDRIHIRKDGTPIHVSISASQIEYAGRRVFQDIVRDETTRIQMEEALKQANANLRELDRLKSVFIASMSHELRTPLNSIIGFTGMIIDDMAGPVSDKQRSHLQRVHRSAHHLLDLVTDIIDVSKIDAGKLAADYTDFDLGDMLNQAREQTEAMARTKGLMFEMKFPTGITVHSDRKRLLQCVLNLLSNAIKYTEQGSVILDVDVVAEEVNIHVKDTGIGLSQADLAQLYQAFTRFESPLKVMAGGSGLGLYLTRKIVREVLDGDVSAQSVEGQGSSFCLSVPLRVNREALRNKAIERGSSAK